MHARIGAVVKSQDPQEPGDGNDVAGADGDQRCGEGAALDELVGHGSADAEDVTGGDDISDDAERLDLLDGPNGVLGHDRLLCSPRLVGSAM